MLEQGREDVQVGVARLLDDDVVTSAGGGKALLPGAVARMGPEQERAAPRPPLSSHQRSIRSTKRRLVRGVRRRVAHHRHERPAGIEPVAAEEPLVVLPWPPAVVHVASGASP